MRVLFSPLGKSDWNGLDSSNEGSLLHIARTYMPDKVVLYFSKETADINCNDPIEEYLKLINQDIQTQVIFRPDMVDVHDFDIFYPEFSELIKEIFNDCPSIELFLNVSSGTPAMKAALLTLAAFGEQSIKAIQVVSPDYAKNRCERASIVDWPNLAKLIKRNNIKKLVSQYDYQAAMDLAQDDDVVTGEVRSLIKGQLLRGQIKLKKAIESFGQNYKNLLPENNETGKLFEQLLYLQRCLSMSNYAEFVRAITPAVTILIIEFCEKFAKVEILDFCRVEDIAGVGAKIRSIDFEKLASCPDIKEAAKIADSSTKSITYLGNHHLYNLIEAKCKSEDWFPALKYAYDFESPPPWEREKNIRNMAAHNIFPIDKETVVQVTKKEPEKVLDKMFSLFNIVNPDFDTPRNSYDIVNEKIINLID